jgi:hypothetical protein
MTAVRFIVSVCTQLSNKSKHRFDITRHTGIVSEPPGPTEGHEFVWVNVFTEFLKLSNGSGFVSKKNATNSKKLPKNILYVCGRYKRKIRDFQ